MPPKSKPSAPSTDADASPNSKRRASKVSKPAAASAASASAALAPAPAAPQPPAPSSYLKIDPTLIDRTGLSVDQLQELIEIFQLVDVDHGGTISSDEVEALMKTLGLRATQSELAAMVKELDQQGTGEIDFESFVGAMSRKVQTPLTAEEIEHAFRTFVQYDENNAIAADSGNHEGVLPTSTVVSILSQWGELDKRLLRSEAEDIIAQVGPHGCENGTFDFVQFIRMYLAE